MSNKVILNLKGVLAVICGNKQDIEKIMPYLSANLQKALAYIAQTNFAAVANGEYEIDGRDVFVRVNTYLTEAKENKKPESHNEYIDVQYLGAGSEVIYFASKTRQHKVVDDQAAANDLLFYEQFTEKDSVHLQAGDFAVFFPWELHRPGCNAAALPQQVQKIVVKVRRV